MPHRFKIGDIVSYHPQDSMLAPLAERRQLGGRTDGILDEAPPLTVYGAPLFPTGLFFVDLLCQPRLFGDLVFFGWLVQPPIGSQSDVAPFN
jgi:hypothetical protein